MTTTQPEKIKFQYFEEESEIPFIHKPVPIERYDPPLIGLTVGKSFLASSFLCGVYGGLKTNSWRGFASYVKLGTPMTIELLAIFWLTRTGFISLLPVSRPTLKDSVTATAFSGGVAAVIVKAMHFRKSTNKFTLPGIISGALLAPVVHLAMEYKLQDSLRTTQMQLEIEKMSKGKVKQEDAEQ